MIGFNCAFVALKENYLKTFYSLAFFMQSFAIFNNFFMRRLSFVTSRFCFFLIRNPLTRLAKFSLNVFFKIFYGNDIKNMKTCCFRTLNMRSSKNFSSRIYLCNYYSVLCSSSIYNKS